MVCILFLGSTHLVSKTGLLSKEADDAITRMLPLPFPFYFGSSTELLKKHGNVQNRQATKPKILKGGIKTFTAVG